MLDINTAVEKFSALIQSRENHRSVLLSAGSITNSPLRNLGEILLNRYSTKLSKLSLVAEQNGGVVDEILENIVSSFALAGILGLNLSKELNELIGVLESVSA